MKHDNRKGVQAQIHIAKKELGLDDDTYRQMIATTTGGKRSCKDCSVAELHQVLQGLKNRGFKAKPRKRVAQHPGTPHNLNSEPMLQKIEALLAELKAPWSYADAIAKRQYRIERVAWLRTVEQFRAVIAALDVELTKRSLLSSLETALKEQDLTLEDMVCFHPNLPKNWQRNRKALVALCSRYMEPEAWLQVHKEEPGA
ncbi:gp16 family protein [Marinobacter salarius]|uniref:gp16 family protein n=1 Tax=Marinobacter salarius TaxID=1420917 RepID=UPI0025A3E445|nr:regulatory protein GemA [Marinobacter salarius]MDM8181276.1 regulatory protein GemA [Marinobacter salarius]